jgi:endonuclease-3
MRKEKAIRQLGELKKYITDKEMRLAAEWPEKYQILIATILSAQTRDELTIKICDILFRKYKSMKSLSKARLFEVRKIIRPINYYKTKSKNIIKTAKIIESKFRGEIPEKIEELLELPGVGRKVANVYLVEAYKAPCIGVDTHVARLSMKLQWTKNKDRHKIEKDLEKLFPKRYWNSINYILVKFGRTYWTKGRREDEILNKIKYIL